jgi:hypothetical protein
MGSHGELCAGEVTVDLWIQASKPGVGIPARKCPVIFIQHLPEGVEQGGGDYQGSLH